jgi:predicted TIM-barrel fold metal-dependent hydrolase
MWPKYFGDVRTHTKQEAMMKISPVWGLLVLTVGLASCATNAEPLPETITPPTATTAPFTNSDNSENEPDELAINLEATVIVDEPGISTEAEVVEEIATTEVVITENKLPIFDTHVHYSQDVWNLFSPSDIIDKMEQANVPRALVSSSPDDGTRLLYDLDPDRIVPFLRPYHDQVTSGNWFEDVTLHSYLNSRLETPIYQGIGEIHLHFEGNADALVVRETARLAVERGLYLHVHSNARVVGTIFEYEPDIKILWAHAGLSESPEVVSEMMDKYANPWADSAIREYQIAPDGELDPTWEALFLKHPDRITIGSDTWVSSRWERYQDIIEFDRKWLTQLPPDVAQQIAYDNAVRLFGAGPHLWDHKGVE